MQQKNIKYLGMTSRPSDYISPDGDLNVCYDLINEDGSLKPIFPPYSTFTLPEHSKFFCIHKINGKKIYILSSVSQALQAYELRSNTLTCIASNILVADVRSVVCVGSTLVIIASDSISYALYKENNYVYLGAKPPLIDLSFGLHGDFEVSDRFTSFDAKVEKGMLTLPNNQTHWTAQIDNTLDTTESSYTSRFNSDKVNWIQSKFTDTLLANINQFIEQRSVAKGRFIFPFFVRYAYRLYDGSHILHSAPILMLPNNQITAFIDTSEYSNNEDQRLESRIAAMICNLDYTVASSSLEINRLGEWNDIIKDIDIFVSAPIYTYDQNGKVVGWRFHGAGWNGTVYNHNSFSQSKIDNGNNFNDGDYANRLDSRSYYKERDFQQLYVRSHQNTATQFGIYTEGGAGGFNAPSTLWMLPTVDVKRVRENITTTALFYKVSSLTISELISGSRKDVLIGNDTLKTLQQREQLQDDYLSHNELSAEYAYNYNARLYLANISQRPFNGFKPSAMLAHSSVHLNQRKTYTAYIFLRKNGKDIVVKSTSTRETSHRPLYLFYPDVDAYKMILDDGAGGAKEFKLTSHSLLNGSYWYGDMEKITLSAISIPLVTRDNIVATPNKLFASDVNNPFFFPVQNRNDIGTSKIVAISSASKALSQGQFGQFPLYAFTLDGIWALEISGNGDISAKQPATRDVINNVDSLLQVDGGVIFTTDQGVMLLSGAESVCISEIIDSRIFAISSLPHIDKLLESFSLPDFDTNIIPFKDYLKESKLAYDYANSRILFFRGDKTYGYIYSLKSKSWSLFSNYGKGAINDYPISQMIGTDNKVFDLSHLNRDATVNGLIITRALKLDTPTMLKTANSLLSSMIGDTSLSRSALYGSVDAINYHLVGSSSDNRLRSIHGTPYKYFIYALSANLRDGESLIDLSILFDIKRNNKLR